MFAQRLWQGLALNHWHFFFLCFGFHFFPCNDLCGELGQLRVTSPLNKIITNPAFQFNEAFWWVTLVDELIAVLDSLEQFSWIFVCRITWWQRQSIKDLRNQTQKISSPKNISSLGPFMVLVNPKGLRWNYLSLDLNSLWGKHTPNQNRPWIWMKKQWFEPNYTMNHFTCIMIVAMVATGRKTSSPKNISSLGPFMVLVNPKGLRWNYLSLDLNSLWGKHTPNQNRPWIWMKKQWFEPNYTMNHFTCIMIVAMVATGKKTSSPKKNISSLGPFMVLVNPKGLRWSYLSLDLNFLWGKHTPNQNRPWIWMKKQWFEPNYTMNHFTCIMNVAMVATGKKTSSPKKISLPWGPSWSW